jgi:hypothetical protein
MRASWFKKHGYTIVDKKGFLGQVLLWKPFNNDAMPPKWVSESKIPSAESDKVNITAFVSGWCPAYNMTVERVKRASKEFRDKIDYVEINSLKDKKSEVYGITDGLYIQGKKIVTGPPPSYEKIRKKIKKAVKRVSK